MNNITATNEKYLSYIGKPISYVKIQMLIDDPNLRLIVCSSLNYYKKIL